TEASTFLVRPVDEPDRHRRDALGLLAPQHLEPGEHAEAAIEPAAGRHRIEVAADHEALRRAAGQGGPQVPRAIALRLDAELVAQLRGEPLARLAPHGAPRDALGTPALIGRQGAQLFEISDH